MVRPELTAAIIVDVLEQYQEPAGETEIEIATSAGQLNELLNGLLTLAEEYAEEAEVFQSSSFPQMMRGLLKTVKKVGSLVS